MSRTPQLHADASVPLRHQRFALGVAWSVSVVYCMTLFLAAVRSYRFPTYEFDPAWLFTTLSLMGIASIVMWRGHRISSKHYWLPVILLLVGLASYPSTSRDPFHYLFDGKTIRLLHLSPYAQTPASLPIDQYSSVFRNTYWFYLPSPYGPLWQAFMTVVNWLSGDRLWLGMLLLKLMNACALLVCARYVYLITQKSWLSFSLLINPILLINTVHTPHTDMVLAALILVAYYHAQAIKRGILISAATAIKPHVVMFAPFFERSVRTTLVLASVTAGTLILGFVALRPVVKADLISMVLAGVRVSSAASPLYSLLLHNLVPDADRTSVVVASYCLFALLYGGIYVVYLSRRLSSLAGLTLTSGLVPLLLYGLVYPWHFIITLVMLSLSDGPTAAEAGLFITLLGFRAPINVLKFAVAGCGAASIHVVLNHLSPPPRFLTWWNSLAVARESS